MCRVISFLCMIKDVVGVNMYAVYVDFSVLSQFIVCYLNCYPV